MTAGTTESDWQRLLAAPWDDWDVVSARGRQWAEVLAAALLQDEEVAP